MTTELLRFVPPVECAPWCEDGDGHPDEHHREDQKCWSPSEYIKLTADNSAEDFDPQIGVMTRQHPDEPAFVHLHLYDIELPGLLPSPWNQLRLASFNSSDIIDNEGAKGPQVVEIMASDTAFSTSNCQPWTLAE